MFNFGSRHFNNYDLGNWHYPLSCALETLSFEFETSDLHCRCHPQSRLSLERIDDQGFSRSYHGTICDSSRKLVNFWNRDFVCISGLSRVSVQVGLYRRYMTKQEVAIFRNHDTRLIAFVRLDKSVNIDYSWFSYRPSERVSTSVLTAIGRKRWKCMRWSSNVFSERPTARITSGHKFWAAEVFQWRLQEREREKETRVRIFVGQPTKLSRSKVPSNSSMLTSSLARVISI